VRKEGRLERRKKLEVAEGIDLEKEDKRAKAKAKKQKNTHTESKSQLVVSVGHSPLLSFA